MLRLEAAKSGLLPTSRPARGRGGFRGRFLRGAAVSAFSPRGGWRGRARGRGFTLSPGSSTLDRRPSRSDLASSSVKFSGRASDLKRLIQIFVILARKDALCSSLVSKHLFRLPPDLDPTLYLFRYRYLYKD